MLEKSGIEQNPSRGRPAFLPHVAKRDTIIKWLNKESRGNRTYDDGKMDPVPV